ncbi:type I-E CRISPR-associated protein Cse1/CasA [Streptomyces echinatus]|uniref:CRISPR system Cascade subunit CasA n=1 Tax=Streptomyces echinatus TaxID=67293 RepID=A0A7W9Q3I7_9ACTN|nr:type I-E CRISPR-associated protein Cse1/CasA [Streptomyces echinatus]MBB5932930.1 CRISPR system Cascade subunit CasA [Streptomyces echinatus]
MKWHHDADPAELTRLAPGALPAAAPGLTSLTPLGEILAAVHLGTLDVPNVAVSSALRRLLAALFIRISGLQIADPDAWDDRWDELLSRGRLDPADVSAYTTEWAFRFNLDDPERPFLQDPRLAKECGDAAAPGKLVMTRASGNNQPWLDRTPQDAPVTPHEAFWWVLVWRQYGPCGLGANRSHNGIKHKSMAAAPLRSVISWHPETGNEFTNLLLSAPHPADIPVTGPDLPEWEQAALPDPLRPELPTGPVSRLVNRAVHSTLTRSDAATGQITAVWTAWRTPVPTAVKEAGAKKALEAASEAVTAAGDPFLINRTKGGPVRAHHARALARDFDSLIHIRRPGDTTKAATIPPAWIRLLDTLPVEALDQIGPVRARALACHQDKQEKEELWFEQVTPVPVANYTSGRHPEKAALVASTRKAAEDTAKALAAALRSAWNEMSPDPRSECSWTRDTIAAYWDRADSRLWQAINDGTDPQLQALAVTLYDDAVRADASTPAGLIPIARARATLTHPKTRRSAKTT